MPARVSEPANIAIGLWSFTLTGSLMGMQYDALLIGFLGGAYALSMQGQMPRPRVIASILFSMVCAGLASPIIAAGSIHQFPWLSQLGDIPRLAAAGFMSLGAQKLVPAAINAVANGMGNLGKALTRLLGKSGGTE